MAKKDKALCAEIPAEHLTAETDWTQLCAEAESVSADEQTAAYLEADEMDFASDAGEAPAADSSDDSSFDMLRAPLMRPTLLEASAGTGKTFSIKHLVLRFVAEEDVSVSRMLIMTFTRAATAELKARIQSHLSAMHGLMTGTFADSAVDAVLLEQRALWAEQGRDPAVIVSRLRESLAQFDNAGIFTIHGFCQKVLEDRAFTSGSSIGFELVENVDDLVEEVVNEFIRTSLLQLSEREDRAAISDPEKWIEILKQLMAAPEDLVPSTIVSLPESPELAAAFQNFVKEAPKRLAQKKCEARVKTFDDLLIELYERLRGDPADAESRAQAQRLAESIRSAFSVVLVDEFQDTDPIQYAVIKRLFLRKREPHPVWFVGDPKQAIYRFRGADLETYLRARRDVEALYQTAGSGRFRGVYALTTNYRSSPDLVRAFNAFWRTAPNPFLREDLAYLEVKSSPKNLPLMQKRPDGAIMDAVPFEWVSSWQETPAQTAAERRQQQGIILTDRITAMIEAGRRGELLVPCADEEASLAVAEKDGKRLRGVLPGDIAVLVRTHDEGLTAAEVLKHRGVRVQIRCDQNVCNTIEACEIGMILSAFAAPGDLKLLRAARTTRLIGDDLACLDDQERDETRRIALRGEFEYGARNWGTVGPAAALERLMTFCRTAERLLPQANGERTLTNYRHLLELLHGAARIIPTPAGLAAWLAAEAKRPVSDFNRERLESDANLVLVETIHSSKGLQYPIVFLPYTQSGSIGTHARCTSRTDDPKRSAQRCLEVRFEAEKPDQRVNQAEYEEKVRVMYVAMTRAARHLCIIGEQRIKSAVNPDQWHSSTAQAHLFRALTGQLTPSRADILPAVERLAGLQSSSGTPLFRFTELGAAAAGAQSSLLTQGTVGESYTTAQSQTRRSEWRTSSFTGITRMAEDDGPGFSTWYGQAEKPPLVDDILSFPKGAQAGTCLHEMMERADFSLMASDDEKAAAARLALTVREVEKHLSLPEKEAASAAAGAAAMIRDLLNAEVAPGVTLKDVPKSARSAELEFLIPISASLTAKRLVSELKAMDPKYDFGTLRPEDLKGFLTGFIDLAFSAGGRFYVLDWKSNKISPEASGYTEKAMSAEMDVHLYRLQYLIYWVALRRFLQVRLGAHWRDEMIGGAIYVFLRGVRAGTTTAANPQGIVFDPVRPEVIRRMDDLFAGRA